MTGAVLDHVDATMPERIARLEELLRFPSIGADSAYDDQTRAAASWLTELLRKHGYEADMHETEGQPIVVGRDLRAGPKKPHLLLYGHYDVQPPGDLALWSTPPFEPSLVRDGERDRIVARGASDDKGNFMTFVEAAIAWAETEGAPPVNLTILVEGDEEGDSRGLAPFLTSMQQTLQADVAIICDTGLWGRDRPAVVTSLRGLLAEEVTIRGPKMDLHSGTYGNAAVNPIHVLADVIASMRDGEGRVRIPGFYDSVQSPSAETRRQWDALGFDGQKFLADVGLSRPAGEAAYSVLEQTWARPTLEVNGISGGYQGDGPMTIIPAHASAKFTFRLVKGQQPDAISRAFRAMVEERIPPDCRVSFTDQGAEPAFSMPAAGRWFDGVKDALEAEWEAPLAVLGDGGSIPVANHFKQILDLDTITTGFVLEDDLAHGPNEKFELRSFRKGIRSWVRIFDRLSS